MIFKNLSVFIFLLLASPTFASNEKYDRVPTTSFSSSSSSPSSTSSSRDAEVAITEQGRPKTSTLSTGGTTKEKTLTVTNSQSRKVNDEENSRRPTTKSTDETVKNSNDHVKFISIEGNLTNVSKNGAIENNFATKENPLLATARSHSAWPESRAKNAGSEPRFVQVSTVEGTPTPRRNPNSPYREDLDDVSKTLLYPVNGTTIVYRETTFRPILSEESKEKTDGGYLPFSAAGKIAPEDSEPGNLEPSDKDIVEAANFGLEAMNNLYYIKEPKLFSMGLFLTEDNPGRYVAAFNDQTEEARQLARFGFAALEGAKSFVSKHPEISRAETFIKNTRRTALHRQCPKRGIPPCPPASLRYRTSDGSCNNPNELWWGSAMSPMQRFLQPVYQDGIQTIRRSVNGRLLPSPREISSFIHQDRNIPLASVTHMLMQWGQFVDHDITATGQSRGFNGTVPQCCLNGGASFQPPEFMHPECLPIPVPATDNFYGPLGVRCLEFLRSGPAPREGCGFGPREQLSQVTSYLDASTVYSSNVQQSDSLRLFRNGLLQYGQVQSRKPLLPRQENDLCRRGSLATSCFRAGDGRLSEQPALISLHVIFLRQHNRIATQLAALNPHWSDEKLFQETRRIIGALIQHITYREFLPIVLGQEVVKAFDLEIKRKGYYEGYDPSINPNIANSFAAAAYRFGHSLVQHSFVRYDSNHNPIFNNVSIHDEFNNPVNLHTVGSVDRLLLGLINQPSQKRDEFITEELTNHLFQTPSFLFGMDLASLNIQRGRDHGLAPYVDWREPCGLSPIKQWADLDRVMFATAARKFRILYASVEDIDLFPAGLAEKPVPGGLVGPTFACIIAQQFSNLRKGDRFWYENPNRESSFTAAQLQQIKRVMLAQILCKTTESIETVQPFVFLTADTFRNGRIPCDSELMGNFDLLPWVERPPAQRRSENKSEDRTQARNGNKRRGQTSNRPSRNKINQIPANPDLEEKSFFSFFRPPNTGVNQNNKVVIKRPSDTHENLTILVQNNAINSPVFVGDSIKGSNFQFTQSIDGTKSGQRPNYSPTMRPLGKPPTQDDDRYTSSRPIYYDDTYPNPVSAPQNSYISTSRPKPKPQIYGHPSSYSSPYIPHGANDPNNPNPPSYGFASRPVNNKVPSNFYLDAFSATTTPRPTLYTFYTTFKRPSSTQRPNIHYYGEIRPQNDQNHHQHDSHAHHQNVYGSSSAAYVHRPATNKPAYGVNDQIVSQKPIYDQSWTSDASYDYDWYNRPVQGDAIGGWSDLPSRPSSGQSYGRPTPVQPSSTASGYWADISTTTKKYHSTDYYYDAEYQIQNAEANINPRPFKKQSVTIITDSSAEIHYPDDKRFQVQQKTEVPKPITQAIRKRPDVPEHKDSFEIDLDKVVDKRTKPGHYYYEKNVLYRYPDGNSAENKSSLSHDKNIKNGYGLNIDKIIIDSKYQIERLDPNREGSPEFTADMETKAQVTSDEIKLTTTATIILDDEEKEKEEDGENEDDYDDSIYSDEGDERKGVTGAYSEKSEHVVLPDAETISFRPIEWMNVQENSSLVSYPEMPNLQTDESISTKEIPKPLTQRKPHS